MDFSKIVSQIGDDMIGKTGEPLGLSKEQAVRVAQALGQHFSAGKDQAVKLAATDAGLTEEVTASMCNKLIEVGKDKLLNEGPVGDAINSMKSQAMGAASAAGGEAMKSATGFLGKLFGKK